MWSPKQLLRPQVVSLLSQAGFFPLQIEFLGWLPGNASALNNSRNPVKAAHTILAGEGSLKMLPKMLARKKESVRPLEVPDHTEVDEMMIDFNKWAESQFPEDEGDEYAAEE